MLTLTNGQKLIKEIMAQQRRINATSFTAKDTPNAAAEMIEAYKLLKTYLQTVEGEINTSLTTAKDVLADIMLETKTTRIEAIQGIAYIPTPSTRTTYDSKALDALCASDQKLAAKIAPFRKTTAIPGSLTIR